MHFSANTNTCGVPQGAIFGSILFLLYGNDIDNLHYPIFITYADRSVIVPDKSNKILIVQFNNTGSILNT